MWRAVFLLFYCLMGCGFVSSALGVEEKVRVALVVSCREMVAHELAALAEVRLSEQEGIVLLERQEVQRLMDEQYLSVYQSTPETCGASQVEEALAIGQFLNVDVFASLEFSSPRKALGLVTFDAVTGTKLGDVTLRATRLEARADEIVKSVLRAIEKRSQPLSEMHRVGIRSVRDSSIGSAHCHTCGAIAELLERRLVESDSILLLERKRLGRVNSEVFLSGGSTGSLLASFTFLDLNIVESDNGSGVEAILLMSDSLDHKRAEIRVSLDASDDILELAEQLVDKVLLELGVASISESVDRELEAKRYWEESKFAYERRDYEAAVGALETAAAFNPKDAQLQHDRYDTLAQLALSVLEKDDGVAQFSYALELAYRALDAYENALHLTAARNRSFGPNEDYSSIKIVGPMLRIWLSGSTKNYVSQAEKLFAEAGESEQEAFLEFKQRVRQLFYFEALNTLAEAKSDRYVSFLLYLMPELNRFVSTSEAWTADAIAIHSRFLKVHEGRLLAEGGWVMANLRTMARLCWWAHTGKVGKLSLQASDVERLRVFFEDMSKHSKPIISAYGRIGMFGIDIREVEELSAEQWALFYEIQTDLYQLIDSPRETLEATVWGQELEVDEKMIKNYRKQGYRALRDLIDFLPTLEQRRKKHEEAFERMLQSRHGVFTLLQLMVDPKAARFMHYKVYKDVFDHTSMGYKESDFPWLEENAKRFEQARAQKGFINVDLSERSFGSGSFDAEFLHMRSQITTEARVPFWDVAQKVHVSDEKIGATLFYDSYLYWVTFKEKVITCLRMSSEGNPVVLGTCHAEKKIGDRYTLSGFCVDGDHVYLGIRGRGVFRFSLNGAEAKALDFGECFPPTSIHRFVCLRGVFYVGVKGGFFMTYDLESETCQTLASSSRIGQESPFDDRSPALRIPAMVADPKRNRIYFSAAFGNTSCDPLLGVWALDVETLEMTQQFRTYQPVNQMLWQADGQLLTFLRFGGWYNDCTWYHFGFVLWNPENGALDHLAADTKKRGVKRAGPDIPEVRSRLRVPHYLAPPFLVCGDTLWFNWKSARKEKEKGREGYRMSLSKRKLEPFARPEHVEGGQFKDWVGFHAVAGTRNVWAVDKKTIWSLTLKN